MMRPALRGVATIVSGSVAGQGLVILATPVLTRLYDPAAFGLFGVFAALAGMLSVVSTGALDRAIPIPADDREAVPVAVAGLVCVVSTALLATAAWVIAAPLADLLGVPALAELWWVVPATVVVFGTFLVLSQWMVRAQSYSALGRRNMLQGLGQAGTQVGLGLAGVRPLGLLLGLGVGRLFACGGLLSRGGLLRQIRPTAKDVRSAFGRFRRFPLVAMPSILVNRAGLELPLLVVSALYGDVRAGMLAVTVRVVGTPTTVISQAVHDVYVGRAGAAMRETDGRMGPTLRYAVRRLLLVGAVPALVLVGAGPYLFAFALGPAWEEAGTFARLLAVSYLLQFAVIPVSSTLMLVERLGSGLAWATARLLLTVGGPALCAALGAPIIVAIAALAAGHVVGYISLYLLCARAANAADRARSA